MRCPGSVAGQVSVLLLASAAVASAQVPAGSQFLVNTYTAGNQSLPVLAPRPDGGIVAVWHSDGQDGSGRGIHGQRLGPDGSRLGGEFQVNAYAIGFQGSAAVSSAPDGAFVVVWASADQDGSGTGVFGQRYDSAGTLLGAEFQVNTATTGYQDGPAVAHAADGTFLVVWESSGQGLWARRYDAAGVPQAAEFRIDAEPAGFARQASIDGDALGNFVVVWSDQGILDNGIKARRLGAEGIPVGSSFRVSAASTTAYLAVFPDVSVGLFGDFVVTWGVIHTLPPTIQGPDNHHPGPHARRFAADGSPLGSEFTVGFGLASSVSLDATGAFVVVWTSGDDQGEIKGQRFDASGARRGQEFTANASSPGQQTNGVVQSDIWGNFLAAWSDAPTATAFDVVARRFGGVQSAALGADPAASAQSDGNGVLEPGETVSVRTAWRNLNGVSQTFGGSAAFFLGPPGPTYTLADATASYGTVANGAVGACAAAGDCFAVAVSGVRPALHWDSALREIITPDALGMARDWELHIGDSFGDVARSSPFYRFIETVLHNSVTGGCGANAYCPGSPASRAQMAAFVLSAKEGPGYAPRPCGTPRFDDVPASSSFCPWIEELARRGVVQGCGGASYCPAAPVTREQMAVFALATALPGSVPPACGVPRFTDVPASSAFCPWIEELARRGIVAGCGGGSYCPKGPVFRGEMSVFVTATFGLALYQP